MKFKSLAGTALLLAAGSATGSLLKDGITPGTPSDVLVSVYDNSTGLTSSGKTFLFNTHLSYGDFTNGTVKFKAIDLSGDANFKALQVSGAKLKFNIVGGYSLADDFSNFDRNNGATFKDKAGTQWGLVTTGHKTADFNGEFGNLSDTTKNRIFAYWSAANVKLAKLGATKTAGPDSVLVDKGDLQASLDQAWGGNFGGGGTANTATANIVDGPGDTSKFYWITNVDYDKGSVVELGTWALSDAGRLTYTGAGYTGSTNTPPVANAGSNQSVAVGTTVTLNGSGSDAEGDSLTYAWSQVSGPSASLAGATSAKSSFKPGSAGTYVFKLTVSDGQASGDATVQVVATAAKTTPTSTPTPTSPGLKLTVPGQSEAITADVPASWKVGQVQTIRLTAPEAKAGQKATIKYAKNGRKFSKTVKTITLSKGSLTWKPAKADASGTGAIQVCVAYDKKNKPVCDVIKVVVQAK